MANNTTWEPKVQDTVTAATQPQQTAKPRASGPLAGVRIVEFAGLGPGPFASMMLSDMGADLVTLTRGEQRRSLRGAVSGLCQPTYILDIPGGHGKVPVGPDYLSESGVEDPAGRRHAYPPKQP